MREPSETQGAGYPKLKIYAAKTALTIEVSSPRDSESTHRRTRNSLVLEAARRLQGSDRYDWPNKIPFWFLLRELPLLACALMGWLDKPLILENHGPHANKSLKLESQGSHLYVRLSEGSRTEAMPVVPEDVHAWAELVLHVLHLNTPSIDTGAQLVLLRRVADMRNRSDG